MPQSFDTTQDKKGFSLVGVVIALGVLALAIGGWYFSSNTFRPSVVQTGINAEEQARDLKARIESQARGEEKQIQATNPGTSTPKNMNHLVALTTNFGIIQFQTYDADAPKAVNNFITLAKKGFYDNLTFHRVIKGFMIQGGDPKGDGTGGPGYAFEDELNPKTPSYLAGYEKGVVAMANAGPNTNGSQFFIMLENYPLPHNYTIFGKVMKGQQVVDTIGTLKTGPNDRPITPVVIEKVSVEETQ